MMIRQLSLNDIEIGKRIEAKKFICDKCNMLLYVTYLSPCNHIFCQKCVDFKGFKCPIDGKEITDVDIIKGQFIDDFIAKTFMCQCINSKEGCEWIGKVNEYYDVHMNKCLYNYNYHDKMSIDDANDNNGNNSDSNKNNNNNNNYSNKKCMETIVLLESDSDNDNYCYNIKKELIPKEKQSISYSNSPLTALNIIGYIDLTNSPCNNNINISTPSIQSKQSSLSLSSSPEIGNMNEIKPIRFYSSSISSKKHSISSLSLSKNKEEIFKLITSNELCSIQSPSIYCFEFESLSYINNSSWSIDLKRNNKRLIFAFIGVYDILDPIAKYKGIRNIDDSEYSNRHINRKEDFKPNFFTSEKPYNISFECNTHRITIKVDDLSMVINSIDPSRNMIYPCVIIYSPNTTFSFSLPIS